MPLVLKCQSSWLRRTVNSDAGSWSGLASHVFPRRRAWRRGRRRRWRRRPMSAQRRAVAVPPGAGHVLVVREHQRVGARRVAQPRVGAVLEQRLRERRQLSVQRAEQRRVAAANAAKVGEAQLGPLHRERAVQISTACCSEWLIAQTIIRRPSCAQRVSASSSSSGARAGAHRRALRRPGARSRAAPHEAARLEGSPPSRCLAACWSEAARWTGGAACVYRCSKGCVPTCGGGLREFGAPTSQVAKKRAARRGSFFHSPVRSVARVGRRSFVLLVVLLAPRQSRVRATRSRLGLGSGSGKGEGEGAQHPGGTTGPPRAFRGAHGIDIAAPARVLFGSGQDGARRARRGDAPGARARLLRGAGLSGAPTRAHARPTVRFASRAAAPRPRGPRPRPR